MKAQTQIDIAIDELFSNIVHYAYHPEVGPATVRMEVVKDEAVRANEAKSLFLSNMSHEIRTPINAALGMNEMILRECKDEQLLSYAANVQSSGRTLLFLINDILDMSKIESGKMEIVKVEYELGNLLMDLWNIIYLRAREKGLGICFTLDETPPRTLFGDDVRIKQIVTNLLTNAVKYTPQGGIEMKTADSGRRERLCRKAHRRRDPDEKGTRGFK